ncbi:hypothetical protein SNL152K_2457 [Streptomyces sp. NL15-2K]|nr:hypothetical protein SNL152K_2457 [Streptomyces sp. NL15-2K]
MFTQTAAAAAGTMVGLMTTDAWQAARQRIARILRREDVERLDQVRAAIDAAPPGRQEIILREQREEWDATLRALLARDPSLPDQLTAFVPEFSALTRPIVIHAPNFGVPHPALPEARTPGCPDRDVDIAPCVHVVDGLPWIAQVPRGQ